jgi:hypothetical protein
MGQVMSYLKISPASPFFGRYVQRFRTAAPQSREERQKSTAADPSDFWWLRDTSVNSGEEPFHRKHSEEPAPSKPTNDSNMPDLNKPVVSQVCALSIICSVSDSS